MDAELRTYLEGMEQRLNSRIDALDGRINTLDGRIDTLNARVTALGERFAADLHAAEERMAALIAGEVGAIHTEMRENFARIDERLNRHGQMLADGTRALSALVDYVERADGRYGQLLRELNELRDRVATIEKKIA